MGNSVCLGPNFDTTGTFPGLSSISGPLTLQADSLSVQSSLANYVALPASFVPAAGPFLAYFITFLSTTDFAGVQDALTKAKIHESILENDVNQYNAEIVTIKNSMIRLNDTSLTLTQLQPEIVYTLRRSEYLFQLFNNQNHLFYRYPLVSMPYFVRITNIFSAVNQIATKLDPSLKVGNDRNLLEMKALIEDYKRNFLAARLVGITYYNCGFTIFSKQCLIYDRPWEIKPGKITNYFLTAYQFDQPLSTDEWRDGIVIRTPNGCQPEARDYPKLKNYKDSEDYAQKLRGYYEDYFSKSFP